MGALAALASASGGRGRLGSLRRLPKGTPDPVAELDRKYDQLVPRDTLLALLRGYGVAFPRDRHRAERIARFVRAHPNCLERSCLAGHITASAWIVSRDGGSALLALHRKLGAWLQLGGHADGDADPARVALREAREESGLDSLEVLDWSGKGLPFDVDVHRIPARPSEPTHFHYDLRFLLQADATERLRMSAESDELRWVEAARIGQLTRERSILRMARRAAEILASGRGNDGRGLAHGDP